MPRSQLFANLESHYLKAGADPHHTQLMLDVAELHSGSVSSPRATPESVERVSAWYLVLNASALLAAIAIYDGLDDAERLQLMNKHQELNLPGGILTEASRTQIELARFWLALSLSGRDASASLYNTGDLADDLNLLRRVLEYAKYFTATNSSVVMLSPVNDYLDYSDF